MGKGGRIACIVTPFILSIASLVCLVLIFLAGTREKNSTLGDLYFFEANLSNFTANPSTDVVPLTNADNSLLSTGLADAKKALNLKDYYSIYLWNYCAWNKGESKYSFCSDKQAYFWFNPVQVWGLNGTGIENAFPKELNNGLSAYHTVSKLNFIFFVIALIATCLEILVGFTAIFSRWGSFATTFFSTASSLFFLAASIVSSAAFATLVGTFNNVLKPYQIHASLGVPFLRTTWLGTAFSLGAGFFWLLSVCCCSGRSPYGGKKDQKRVKVEKTPYTYERVGSPYLGPQAGPQGSNGPSVPMFNLNKQGQSQGAYEPFRQTQ